MLASLSTGLFALGGLNAGFGLPYFIGLGGVAAHYGWQIYSLNIDNRESCWNRFVSNRYLGLLLMFAIIAGKIEFVDDSDEIIKE